MMDSKAYRQIINKKTIIATICLLLLSVLACPLPAQAAYEIYTYGSGDFVRQVLMGVVLIFNGGIFETLIKVILVAGVMVAVLRPITAWLSKGSMPPMSGGDGIIALVRQVILAAVVLYVFMIPRADVLILDRIDPLQSGHVVNNVPLAQAVVAHAASKIGSEIGDVMEAAFSIPDAIKMRNGGVALGVKYIDSIYDIQPPSGGTHLGAGSYFGGVMVRQSLREYIGQCVLPYFSSLDGTSGQKAEALYRIVNSSDIIQTMQFYSDIYADPIITISAPTPTGWASCMEALPAIQVAWQNVNAEWMQEVESKVIGTSTVNPAIIGSGVLTQQILTNYFPFYAGTPVDMLKNIAVINVFKDSVRDYEAIHGNPNNYSSDLALNTSIAGWKTTARVFSTIVQVMRNIFEGLIYGLSAFLPVFIAIAGLAPLFTFMKMALWLQLWVPFYVILNLFGDMEMARTLQQLGQATDGNGPSVKMWQEVGEKAQLSLAYIGSLSFMVPTLAWGVLNKGGEYAASAMHSLSSGSDAAQTASSVGGQIVGQGNVNVGTRRVANDMVMGSTMTTSGVNYMNHAGAATGALVASSATQRSVSAGGAQSQMIQSSNTAGSFDAASKFPGGPVSALYDTAHSKTQSEVKHWDAMSSVAEKHGFKSVGDLAGAITTAEGGAKAKMISDLKSHFGTDEQGAAEAIATLNGMGLAQKTAQTEKYYNTLKDLGMSHIDAGKAMGNLDAAQVHAVAAISENQVVSNEAWKKFREVAQNQGEIDYLKNLKRQPGETTEALGKRVLNDLAQMRMANAVGEVQAVDAYRKSTGQSRTEVAQQKQSAFTIGNENGKESVAFDKKGNVTNREKMSGDTATYNNGTVKHNYGTDYNLGNATQLGAARMNMDDKMLKESMPKGTWQDPKQRQMTVMEITKGLEASFQTTAVGSTGNTTSLGANVSGSVSTLGKNIIGSGLSLGGSLDSRSSLVSLNTTQGNTLYRDVSQLAEKISNDKTLKTNDARWAEFSKGLQTIYIGAEKSMNSGAALGERHFQTIINNTFLKDIINKPK